jgi:anti-sigma-K factor RskA
MSDAPETPDLLAGEYVMGLLDAAEMQTVRRQAVTDARLSSAIADWEHRLYPMVELVAPVTPPIELWARIERDLSATVAEPPVAERVVPLRGPDRSRPSIWRSANLWRATTAASLALAAAFAAIAYVSRTTPPTTIAALAPMGGPAPAFLAELQPDGRLVVSAVAPASVPDGRDLELWLLPPGAQRPTSLGVLPQGGKSIQLPTSPPVGSQLLVSLEPAGGSPTGQPTGSVLYGGRIQTRSGT